MVQPGDLARRLAAFAHPGIECIAQAVATNEKLSIVSASTSVGNSRDYHLHATIRCISRHLAPAGQRIVDAEAEKARPASVKMAVGTPRVTATISGPSAFGNNVVARHCNRVRQARPPPARIPFSRNDNSCARVSRQYRPTDQADSQNDVEQAAAG